MCILNKWWDVYIHIRSFCFHLHDKENVKTGLTITCYEWPGILHIPSKLVMIQSLPINFLINFQLEIKGRLLRSNGGTTLGLEVHTRGIINKISTLECERAYRSACCPSSCPTPCPSRRREHWSPVTYRKKTKKLEENELLIQNPVINGS